MRLVPDLLSLLRYNIYPDAGDSKKIPGNPYEQFEKWMNEACLNNMPLPDSIGLKMEEKGTSHSDNSILVIKGFTKGMFTFFTSYDGTVHNDPVESYAVITLLWSSMYRRIKIKGRLVQIPEEDSKGYDCEKPFISQIRSAAGNSMPVKTDYYPGTDNNQMQWKGYYLDPRYIEFCHGHLFLLNYRIKYSMRKEKTWNIKRLFPLVYYG